jgi:hypothetical protein
MDDSPIAHLDQQVVLDRRKIAHKYAIPAHVFGSIQARLLEAREYDHFLYALDAMITTKSLPQEAVTATKHVEFSSPATWWQHWKHDHRESWWAGWFVRWRGVRMKETVAVAELEVGVERFYTFPEFDFPLPDPKVSHVKFHMQTRSWFDR